MAIPVWAVGQVLSASDVNSWFVPVVAVKPSDTSRLNTTSISNDPDLQLSLAANAIYEISGTIQYKGATNGTGDAQFQLNAPSGSTGFWVAFRTQVTGTFPTFSWLTNSFGSNVNAGTNGTGGANWQPFFLKASCTTATAGTLAVAWAQNTANNTTATSVLAGSVLSAQRIG